MNLPDQRSGVVVMLGTQEVLGSILGYVVKYIFLF